MSDAEDLIYQKFHNAKRNLDLLAGLCFIISLVICPTLYFVFGNLVFILFLPILLLVVIEVLASCALTYLKRRALRRLEDSRLSNPESNHSESTEAKKLPKKFSGIVTIPQHQQALQYQIAQMHHTLPPQYETLQPPSYQVVILSNASAAPVHQQNNLRY